MYSENRKKEMVIAALALGVVYLSTVFGGIVFELNKYIPSFYTIHHFLGGFFVALFFHGYIFKTIKHQKTPWHLRWLIIVGITILVGVIWEFIEFAGSNGPDALASHIRMGDLKDTMSDLLYDIFGALLFLIMAGIKKR